MLGFSLFGLDQVGLALLAEDLYMVWCMFAWALFGVWYTRLDATAESSLLRCLDRVPHESSLYVMCCLLKQSYTMRDL